MTQAPVHSPANASAATETGPRIWVLIPCAGSGSRAGTARPKQYEKVAGRPMVLHTLDVFARLDRVTATLVVVSTGDTFFEVSRNQSVGPGAYHGATLLIADCGGSTRAGSVLYGLNHLLGHGAASGDWVLVHDAARCLITPAQVQALMEACLHDDVGGLLAHKLPDTLKRELAGRVAATIDRSDKWLAQTPQMFRIGMLKDALQSAGAQVTDESSAMEASGFKPKLVPGSAQNFKVTYPEDFALAEAVLLERKRGGAKRSESGTPVVSASYDYP